MSLITHTEKSHNPRRKRRRRWIWVFLILPAVFVWFLPSLATHPSVWPKLAKQFAPELDGKVSLSQVKASWLSPVVIQELTVRDLQGQPMVAVKQINTERSLFGLLKNFRDLGTIHFTEPQLNLRLSGNSSNAFTSEAKAK